MDGTNAQLLVFLQNLPQIIALGEKLEAAQTAIDAMKDKRDRLSSQLTPKNEAEYRKYIDNINRQLYDKDLPAYFEIRDQLRQLGKDLGLDGVTFSGTSPTTNDDLRPNAGTQGQGLEAALRALATAVTSVSSNDGLQVTAFDETIVAALAVSVTRLTAGAIVSRILAPRAATVTLYSYSATPLAGSAFASTTGRVYLTTWGPGEWLYARGLLPGLLRTLRTGRFSPYPMGAAVFTTGPIVPSAFGLARIFPQTANFWKFFGGQYRSGLGISGYSLSGNTLLLSTPIAAGPYLTAQALLGALGELTVDGLLAALAYYEYQNSATGDGKND